MKRTTSQHTTKRSTRRYDTEPPESARASRGTSMRSERRGSSTRANETRNRAANLSRTGRTAASAGSRRTEPSGARHAEPSGTRQASAREERRRSRTKARADRMFDRQFATSPQARGNASGEGGPRAAVYKGEMGATHRKSARMQRSSEAGSPSVKLNPAGWFSHIPFSLGLLRTGTAVLCIALVALFLYTPAQQYYQAQREHDKIAAEYSVVAQRNDALDFQHDSLASNAGMEDAVRQKYGYIVSGEETAVVTGLSDETLNNVHSASDVEANVLSSSVKAPEEWYTPYLDAFFGVE